MKRVVAVAAAAALVSLVGLRAPAESAIPRSQMLARGAQVAAAIRCSQCHSADRKATNGKLAYAGGRVDDWYAPAINSQPDARIPWTEDELYSFLRTGSSPLHGIAAGSMSKIVHEDLARLPDEDIAALAAYFADVTGAPPEVPVEQVAAAMKPEFVRLPNERRGEWLFTGYCVSCHFNKAEAQTSKRPELALNTAISAPDPTNLLRVVLGGVSEEEGRPDEYMPGFAMLLTDRDAADIAAYLRSAYAPGQKAWAGLQERAKEIRELKDKMR